MSKKLIAVCTVFAALAALPSFASAKPVITHPTGTVMAIHPEGTTCSVEPKGCLLATNIGNTKLTVSGLPSVECTTAKWTGDLKVNNAANGYEIEITSAEEGGTGTKIAGDPEPECTGGSGPSGVTWTSLPWCLEGTEASDNFAIKGGKCGAATSPITFDLSETTIFGTLTCKYVKNTKIAGTFTTHATGDAVLTISEVSFARHESPESCPAELKLDMSFTVETDISPASQVWIS